MVQDTFQSLARQVSSSILSFRGRLAETAAFSLKHEYDVFQHSSGMGMLLLSLDYEEALPKDWLLKINWLSSSLMHIN